MEAEQITGDTWAVAARETAGGRTRGHCGRERHSHGYQQKRDSVMMDKDARRTILSTEAQDGTQRSRESVEEVSAQVGGRTQGRGPGQEWRVGGVTVKSKAKTPLK